MKEEFTKEKIKMKFTELGLKPALLEQIKIQGFDETTKIQEKVIPEIKQLNREQGDLIEITNSLGKTLSKGESSITKALFGDIEQSALLKGARALKPIGKGKYVAPLLRGQAGNVPRLVTNE